MKRLLFFSLLGLISIRGTAQEVQFSTGKTFTTYQLVNTQGLPFEGLKTASGSSMSLSYLGVFVDTLQTQKENPDKALSFSQHKTRTKILSIMHYSLGLHSFQMNALGAVQQIPLRYETEFVGLEAGIGIKFRVKNLLHFSARGIVSGNKLLMGTEVAGTNIYDLRQVNQFNDIKWMGGFEVQIQKKINPWISAFLQYQQTSTLSPTISDTGKLDFINKQYSIGISYHLQ
jgi:hypothetical protein